jgi:hypothetical protein
MKIVYIILILIGITCFQLHADNDIKRPLFNNTVEVYTPTGIKLLTVKTTSEIHYADKLVAWEEMCIHGDAITIVHREKVNPKLGTK